MRTTQKKGDLGVSNAIFKFTEAGWDVSIPLTESASYDLIVDDGELHRVQVKYCSGKDVDLRNIHSNSKGYVVKKTIEATYDWLYIYRSDGKSFLIKKCLIGATSITPKDSDLFGESNIGACSNLENCGV